MARFSLVLVSSSKDVPRSSYAFARVGNGWYRSHTVQMTKSKAETISTNNTLRMPLRQGEDERAALAKTVLRPSVRAALTTQKHSKQFGELDLTSLVDELSEQISAANRGDMRRAEGMLVAQAHTLDALFHELVRRSTANSEAGYLGAAEIYMRLALKGQSQCRAALEALAEMKNPKPVTFVRQANVAHGPQQVNNGPQSPAEASRARESENQPNKLLEQQHGERLDFGATQAPIGADSPLAGVDKLPGSRTPRGKGA